MGNASRFKKTCPLSEQEPSDSLGHPCPVHETNFKKPMNTLLPFMLRPVNQAIRRAVDGLNQGFVKASSPRRPEDKNSVKEPLKALTATALLLPGLLQAPAYAEEDNEVDF